MCAPKRRTSLDIRQTLCSTRAQTMILFCFFSVSSEWLTGLTETGVQIAKMGHFMILVATFVDGEPRCCMPWSSGNETFHQFSNSKMNPGNETSGSIRWNYVTDSDELFDGVFDLVILASKSTEHEAGILVKEMMTTSKSLSDPFVDRPFVWGGGDIRNIPKGYEKDTCDKRI